MFLSQTAQTLRICSRRLLAPCSFLLLLALLLPGQLSADPLADIIRLAEQGASELALQQIDSRQPNPLDHNDDWLRWERQRIALYKQAGKWQTLLARIGEQASFIPVEFQEWFATQRIEAHIALGNGGKARKLLRELIWLRDKPHDKAALSQWRTQVVRSYLLDNMANAAHGAMLKREQDYKVDTSEESVLLRARVLLLADRPRDAEELLRKEKSLAARSLYLVAALRSAVLPASKVIAEVDKTLRKKKLDANLQLRLFALKAEASKVEGDTGQRAAAIENYLARTRKTQIDDGLFHLDGEQLWQAYREHGLAFGNKQQLLLGDDASWFTEADKHGKKPLRQRTLYGALVVESRDPATVELAHEKLINTLRSSRAGIEVLRHLYLDNQRFSSYSELPALARYSLLEQALRDSDIPLASELLAGLKQAPKGIEPLQWELRRARVFVLAGKPADATAVLDKILETQSLDDKQSLDRFMQVVFDLQTIEAHEQAVSLFEKLLTKFDLPQFNRELYYWMADSRKAQGRHADAAALYLKSSESKIGPQPDLWAQSAIYQAAESLAKAGLVDDAKHLYEQLLVITKDEARRGQLQRRLQQLWLKRNQPGEQA